MTIQRLTNTAVVLTVFAASTLAPAGASAGSLLSGYGGPGQGNQEILGAGLVNGPSGGGSGGGSSSAAPAAGAAAAAASASGSGAQGAGAALGAAGTGAAHQAARSSRGRAGTRAGAAAAVTGARARTAANAPAATQASAGGDTFGLSGDGVLDVLLVLAALALIGFATRRMTRGPGVGTHAG